MRDIFATRLMQPSSARHGLLMGPNDGFFLMHVTQDHATNEELRENDLSAWAIYFRTFYMNPICVCY